MNGPAEAAALAVIELYRNEKDILRGCDGDTCTRRYLCPGCDQKLYVLRRDLESAVRRLEQLIVVRPKP